MAESESAAAVPAEAARRGPRGPYANGRRQRAKILATAAGVFARRGYAGGSLREIAKLVGVTPGAILMHFGSKEGLLMAVLAEWGARASVAHEEERGLAYLRGLVELMRSHLDERGFIELFSTMATEASDPQHPAHEFMVNRYRVIESRIASEICNASADRQIRTVADDQLEPLAHHVIAMMDGLQVQWLLNPELNLVGEFELFVEGLIARLS